MLASDKPAVAVTCVAVGEIGRRAEDRNLARLLVPAQHAIVRQVAPDQATLVAEIDGPFGPAHPAVQFFEKDDGDYIAAELLVEDLKNIHRTVPPVLPEIYREFTLVAARWRRRAA